MQGFLFIPLLPILHLSFHLSSIVVEQEEEEEESLNGNETGLLER